MDQSSRCQGAEVVTSGDEIKYEDDPVARDMLLNHAWWSCRRPARHRVYRGVTRVAITRPQQGWAADLT